ncbi:MAG: 50S ribosomal protein L10, partial [Acidobacteriota bacterium]
LREVFSEIDSFYLLSFSRLSVAQAAEFRRRLKEKNYSIRVIKNRLALRAIQDEHLKKLKEYFRGPTAVAFAPEDPVGLAKIIKEFSSQAKVLEVKAGILEGKFLAPEKFQHIANLGPRDELLAQFGYLMAFPMIKFYQTWQAPLQSLGRLLSQLKFKK